VPERTLEERPQCLPSQRTKRSNVQVQTAPAQLRRHPFPGSAGVRSWPGWPCRWREPGMRVLPAFPQAPCVRISSNQCQQVPCTGCRISQCDTMKGPMSYTPAQLVLEYVRLVCSLADLESSLNSMLSNCPMAVAWVCSFGRGSGVPLQRAGRSSTREESYQSHKRRCRISAAMSGHAPRSDRKVRAYHGLGRQRASSRSRFPMICIKCQQPG
jgi:hypothetical protein